MDVDKEALIMLAQMAYLALKILRPVSTLLLYIAVTVYSLFLFEFYRNQGTSLWAVVFMVPTAVMAIAFVLDYIWHRRDYDVIRDHRFWGMYHPKIMFPSMLVPLNAAPMVLLLVLSMVSRHNAFASFVSWDAYLLFHGYLVCLCSGFAVAFSMWLSHGQLNILRRDGLFA